MAAPAKTSAEANPIPKMARIDSTRIAQTAIAASFDRAAGLLHRRIQEQDQASRKSRRRTSTEMRWHRNRELPPHRHKAALRREVPRSRQGLLPRARAKLQGPARLPAIRPVPASHAFFGPVSGALPRSAPSRFGAFRHGPALAAEAGEAPIEESPRQSKPEGRRDCQPNRNPCAAQERRYSSP